MKKKTGMVLLAVLLGFMIVLPIISVFARTVISEDGRFDIANAATVLSDPANAKTILNSLWLALLVSIVSTLISTPLAFILTRTKLARMKWLDIILMIPFMTPPYISAMGWILFMQKRGLFQQLFPWTESWLEGFFSLAGLVMVMSFHSFPFMTGMIKNAILNLGSAMEESAAICGEKPIGIFRKVTMPLLTGNYAIALMLVFVKTLSEYGTPATLGSRIGFYVFTTNIHRYASVAPIDFGKASALSSVLVIICFAIWRLQDYITRTHTYSLVQAKRTLPISQKRIVTVLGTVYTSVLILISIVVPYFSIIATSLIDKRGYGLAKGNFTLAHYGELFGSESAKGLRAIGTSLSLAAAAATIASLIGMAVAMHMRKKGKLSQIIGAEALLPEMIPNIVFAIGMMILWNRIYAAVPLYNTRGFMVLVYVVMFLPYAVQYTTSALIQIGDHLSEAGRISGGSESYVFWRIQFPLMFPGVVTGWMMIFIISFRELVASSLTSPPNVLTVSTFITHEFEQGSVSVGMCMAAMCVLITTVSLIAINQLAARKWK